jgi:hypothetical protein
LPFWYLGTWNLESNDFVQRRAGAHIQTKTFKQLLTSRLIRPFLICSWLTRVPTLHVQWSSRDCYDIGVDVLSTEPVVTRHSSLRSCKLFFWTSRVGASASESCVQSKAAQACRDARDGGQVATRRVALLQCLISLPTPAIPMLSEWGDASCGWPHSSLTRQSWTWS